MVEAPPRKLFVGLPLARARHGLMSDECRFMCTACLPILSPLATADVGASHRATSTMERTRGQQKNKKGVAFGGTRTHANKVDYDLNVAP
jgi:hypothetical protein